MTQHVPNNPIPEPPDDVMSPARKAQIDDFVQGRMQAGRVPGAAVVIAVRDQVIYRAAYGLANIARQAPMTEDTPVAIGSTGKGMTALAIMQFVEQGHLDLDAPVTTYLPFFRTTGNREHEITVRHLLAHSAGLPAGFPGDPGRDPGALERYVQSLSDVELNRDPGTGFEYANSGYAVAGLIIQALSGLSYEEYLRHHLFQPLEMKRTTFDREAAEQFGLAQGYVTRRGEISAEPIPFGRAINPAGGVISTAIDVGHYLIALSNEGVYHEQQVITPASLSEMWRPQIDVGGGISYGFGWFTMSFAGLDIVAHTGDIITSGSSFGLIPNLNLGIGVLVNLDSDTKDEIARGVLSLVLGLEPQIDEGPERGPSAYTPDPDTLDNYAGTYETRQGVIRLHREGDRLIGSILNHHFELEAYSDTAFVSRSDLPALDDADVSLQPQEDGSIVFALKGVPFGIKLS